MDNWEMEKGLMGNGEREKKCIMGRGKKGYEK